MQDQEYGWRIEVWSEDDGNGNDVYRAWVYFGVPRGNPIHITGTYASFDTAAAGARWWLFQAVTAPQTVTFRG